MPRAALSPGPCSPSWAATTWRHPRSQQGREEEGTPCIRWTETGPQLNSATWLCLTLSDWLRCWAFISSSLKRGHGISFPCSDEDKIKQFTKAASSASGTKCNCLLAGPATHSLTHLGKKSLSITKQINACCSSHWRHAARSHPCEKWQDCKSSPAVCSICSWASLSWACIWKHSLVFGLRDFTKFNTSLMVHMDPFLKLSVGLCKGWHVFLWPPEFPKWI